MTSSRQIRNQQLKLPLAKLKEAYKLQDVDAIDKALAELNSVWQVASEEMYKTAQNSDPDKAQPGAEQPSGNNPKPGNEEVTDVDFEEVK